MTARRYCDVCGRPLDFGHDPHTIDVHPGCMAEHRADQQERERFTQVPRDDQGLPSGVPRFDLQGYLDAVTPGHPSHEVELHRSPLGDAYEPACRCGWFGPVVGTEASAVAAARVHIHLVTAGSAS